MTFGTTRMGQRQQNIDCFACLYDMNKTTTEPVCMYFVLPACMTRPRPRRNLFACILHLQNQHPLRIKILRVLIKYAHNTYDGRTRKMPSEDTIVLLPEEKANSCQCDSECWRVPGACTYILIDDRVTSMINAFDIDNSMLGKITFFENLPFLTDWPDYEENLTIGTGP